jgi:hypothetical protein
MFNQNFIYPAESQMAMTVPHMESDKTPIHFGFLRAFAHAHGKFR